MAKYRCSIGCKAQLIVRPGLSVKTIYRIVALSNLNGCEPTGGVFTPPRLFEDSYGVKALGGDRSVTNRR